MFSAYSSHLQVLTTFLLKEFYIICILYKSLLARKLSKPEDGRYRPKRVVFTVANKQHHLTLYL